MLNPSDMLKLSSLQEKPKCLKKPVGLSNDQCSTWWLG